jgi:hypothetical protein
MDQPLHAISGAHLAAIRREITTLSNVDLAVELSRPTGQWDRDCEREALQRILLSLAWLCRQYGPGGSPMALAQEDLC